MSILQEILTWSKDLPDWQSDAIAGLFSKGAIADADFHDDAFEGKIEHAILLEKSAASGTSIVVIQ